MRLFEEQGLLCRGRRQWLLVVVVEGVVEAVEEATEADEVATGVEKKKTFQKGQVTSSCGGGGGGQ